MSGANERKAVILEAWMLDAYDADGGMYGKLTASISIGKQWLCVNKDGNTEVREDNHPTLFIMIHEGMKKYRLQLWGNPKLFLNCVKSTTDISHRFVLKADNTGIDFQFIKSVNDGYTMKTADGCQFKLGTVELRSQFYKTKNTFDEGEGVRIIIHNPIIKSETVVLERGLVSDEDDVSFTPVLLAAGETYETEILSKPILTASQVASEDSVIHLKNLFPAINSGNSNESSLLPLPVQTKDKIKFEGPKKIIKKQKNHFEKFYYAIVYGPVQGAEDTSPIEKRNHGFKIESQEYFLATVIEPKNSIKMNNESAIKADESLTAIQKFQQLNSLHPKNKVGEQRSSSQK